jgi:hypothetical protein
MDAPTAAVRTHHNIGTPPPGYHNQEWVTHTVHCHNFASLSTERDVSVDSPEFEGLGSEWSLEIFPGGDEDANEGMVTLYLWNFSSEIEDVIFEYGFSIFDGNGKQVAYKQQFASMRDDEAHWGWENFKTIEFSHQRYISH